MKKHLNNRGVTILEIVIAITVISIVSVAALSAIQSGINIQRKAEVDRDLRTCASNVYEVFLATDENNFASTLEEIGISLVYKDDNWIYTSNGIGEVIFTINFANRYFSAEGEVNDQDIFYFTLPALPNENPEVES